MTVRQPGRLLFFGITPDRRIIGWVTAPDSILARALGELQQTGVLRHVPLGTADTSRDRLLAKLIEIHEMGWVDSRRLRSSGPGPCTGSNCGGYTLEAHFGILPNGRAEPGFRRMGNKGTRRKRFCSIHQWPANAHDSRA
jgi:hypothetical protein